MRPRLLIVDDDAELRSELSVALAALGYDVDGADNGRDALAILTRPAHPLPLLILADWSMPEMGGSELVDAIRSYRRLSLIPIVILTARHAPPTVDAPVLSKPFTLEQLLAVIREHSGPEVLPPGN